MRLPGYEMPSYSLMDPTIVLPEASPSDFAQTHHISFVLKSVEFDGATLFSEDELLKIFADSLEHKISIADLQSLVDQVSAKYRDAGYLLSQAFLPEQEIESGQVRIKVSEGFVGELEVLGDIDSYSKTH